MHIIELTINKFLKGVQKGGYKIPQHLLDKFGNESKKALKAQFEREPKNFTLRMSNVGMPSCILQMEKKYGNSNTNITRNLLGDMVEDLVLFLLHASGLRVISELEHISLDIAGIHLKGTLDVILDLGNGHELYDIKSASEYSFKNKFRDGGFQELWKNDPFGYVGQLFAYAEARKVIPGGWIIANKSTGEILVVSVPKEYSNYRNISLEKIANNIKIINENKPFKRQFEPIKETYRKKETGNLILGNTCSFCAHKYNCWGDIQTIPQLNSTSKNPRLMDYIYIKDEN